MAPGIAFLVCMIAGFSGFPLQEPDGLLIMGGEGKLDYLVYQNYRLFLIQPAQSFKQHDPAKLAKHPGAGRLLPVTRYSGL